MNRSLQQKSNIEQTRIATVGNGTGHIFPKSNVTITFPTMKKRSYRIKTSNPIVQYPQRETVKYLDKTGGDVEA